MKKWFILFAATAAMTSFAPVSSSAQGVSVEVPGVGVRIGEPRREERGVREDRREDRLYERDVRGGPECRTVTVQEETPTGMRTVSRKKCD